MSSPLIIHASPSAGSPRNASHRQLMPPTDGWTADVVSVIPKDVVKLLPTFVVAAISQCRWHCIASADPDDDFSTVVLHVWHDLHSATLEDQKERSLVLELTHETLSKTSLLLALETNSTTYVQLYALNAATGDLVMWVLSPKDFTPNRRTSPYPSAITTVQLDGGRQPERIMSLAVGRLGSLSSMPTVIVGTSLGKLYWIKQTASPISLIAQEVVARSMGLADGLLSRLFSPGPKYRESTSTGILKVLLTTGDHFYAFSQHSIVEWKVSAYLESSGRADFDRVRVTNLTEGLLEYFQQQQRQQTSQQEVAPPLIQNLSIITAASSPDATTLHTLVLTHSCAVGSNLVTSRLYWVVLLEGKILVAKWLSRFGDPKEIHSQSMLLAENRFGYLALVSSKGSVPPLIFMAMDESTIVESDVVVHELDLPATDAGVFLTSISPDVETHGCCALTTHGLGIRVRKVADAKKTETAPPTTSSFNPTTVRMLIQHLQASFRHAYAHPSDIGSVSPSLHTSSLNDVEEAVVTFCKELQASSSPQSILECHTAFIDMLKQARLYRTLSTKCRWNLLDIGQQVAVFQALMSSGVESESLRSTAIEEWLVLVESDVFQVGVMENRQLQFLGWLCLALKAAAAYRDDKLLSLYDISEDSPPLVECSDKVPIWTCDPTVQALLTRQITRWSSNEGPRRLEDVETVVIVALRSFSESYKSCKNRQTETSYATMQQIAITLLRSLKSDQLAWALSRDHYYFAGLCEIAYDHEHLPDRADYSLEPLFRFFNGRCCAAQVGLPFCQFVLSWHVRNGLWGHVLQLGEHCPGALSTLIENDEGMRPFKWIHAVRNGDYDKAAESLLSNAKNMDLKPKKAKIELSIASIANLVAESEGTHAGDQLNRRRSDIDKMRDLVALHEELLGNEAVGSLQSPGDLLDIALKQLDEAHGREQKVSACFSGLSVCTTFASTEDVQKHAGEVWLRAINVDSGWLQDSIGGAPDLANKVLDETVFGGLLEKCIPLDSSWDNVVYTVAEKNVRRHLSADVFRIISIAASLAREGSCEEIGMEALVAS